MRGRTHTIAPHTLIGEEELRRKLRSIFTDSIILDSGFRIVVVSNNVLDMLEFRSSELQGKNINYITGSYDFVSFMTYALQPGFFQEKTIDLISKSTKRISSVISGFYLGLVSDVNGYIVLKLHDAEAIQSATRELDAKRTELDNFIYRTAHDLRGPLATIRGLINLYNMKKDEFEADHLIQLINLHAVQLDEKLFKLLYLAESDQSFSEPTYVLEVRLLETYLRRKIEADSFIDFLDFHVNSSTEKIQGVNELLVFSLAGNMLHFMLNLPKSSTHDHQLTFSLSVVQMEVHMRIMAKGFTINDETRSVLSNFETFYGDILTYPDLFNYFAALKIAISLKATIQLMSSSFCNHEIMISIPKVE
jgi:hypothetical protein